LWLDESRHIRFRGAYAECRTPAHLRKRTPANKSTMRNAATIAVVP
jgi:hypothetical protein